LEVVSDAGGIYAIYDVGDEYHAAVMRVVGAEKRIIVPTPLLGELGYLLGARLGPRALSTFLQDLAEGVFALEPFLPQDVRRCRELVDKYADLELGLTDAAVIATAERLNVDRILTVDERDFRPIRNAHGAPFVLLPLDEPTS
jgi:predicted nucleic acid-binding protein